MEYQIKKLGPHMDLANVELQQMAVEIERLGNRGQQNELSFLQALYLDRVYEQRQKTAEQLFEQAILYLGDPETQRELPSLMDACDGDPAKAAKYVLWYMLAMSADGVDWGLGQTAREVDTAFANMTILNGEDRFR